uniref:NIPSNAP domain-containing protein n=1 Tax=Micrurus surinamensis TaxID=129470 RepID=A0A2D4PG15_MICSU
MMLQYDDRIKKKASSFATGPRQADSTFYEFRTYTIKPNKMKDFLDLTSKTIHLRTAHCPMVGYWTLEFGELNKVFHIWKYGTVYIILYYLWNFCTSCHVSLPLNVL